MPAPDPRIGTVLHDRYLVLERMSEGSMGVVYRGERVKLRRPVAIKYLNEGYAASQEGMRRFEVEARAMSRLAHPNCVAVTDFGLDQGAPYLVMDFITGRTLRQVLQQEGRMFPSRALGIMRQVLAGLAHAHAQSIIHRDVKPENILLTQIEGHGEQVRIVDFGLAKLRDEGSVTTGVAVGTPGYMSPEQTAGEKVDQRADLYATGIILFELLTGRKPFQSEIIFEVLRMHRETPPPSLSSVAPDLASSPRLNAVVQRALAKQRDERFASASEFLAALEAASEADGQPDRPARGRRRRGLVLLAAGLLLLGALGAGVWTWRRARAQHAAAGSSDKSRAASKKRPEVARATRSPDGRELAPIAAAGADPGAAAATDAADAAVAAEAPGDESVAGEPADIAQLRAKASAGDLPGAVRGLEALRKREPERAAVHYALGNLYAELQSWLPAVKAYAATLDLDPAYKSDDRLIGDLVEALASDKAYATAATVIRLELGKSALPRLEQAARSSTPRLRARARRLRAQLNRSK